MAGLGLDRLSSREKTLFVLCVVALTCMVVARLVVEPVRMRFREMSVRIDSSKAVLFGNRAIIAQKGSIEELCEKYGEYVTAVTPTPDVNIEQEMFNEIERCADGSNVAVLDRKPQGVEEKGIFREHLVRVEVEAPMPELMRMFYHLEQSPQLLRVRKMDLSPSANDKTRLVKGVLVVSKIVTA